MRNNDRVRENMRKKYCTVVKDRHTRKAEKEQANEKVEKENL